MQPYPIFVQFDKYSPLDDKEYDSKGESFVPDKTVVDAYGVIHKWKKNEKFFQAVEIYPIHFLDYPKTRARRVQHVKEITEKEFQMLQ